MTLPPRRACRPPRPLQAYHMSRSSPIWPCRRCAVTATWILVETWCKLRRRTTGQGMLSPLLPIYPSASRHKARAW